MRLNHDIRDVGDEVPVLPCSSLAAPLQIRAETDHQLLQSREVLYPLRQGFDARAVVDSELLKRGGEAADGLWKASQPPQIINLEFA